MFAKRLLARLGLDLESYGYIERRKGRSVVTLASDPEAISTIGDLLELIRENYPRNHVVFLAKDAAERNRLSEDFPGDRILAYPRTSGYAHGRIICKLSTQLLLVVGIPERDLTRWLDQALRADTSVIMIDDGKIPRWHEAIMRHVEPSLLQRIMLFVTRDPASIEALGMAGVATKKIYQLATDNCSKQSSATPLIERLQPALTTKKKPAKYWRAQRRVSMTKIKQRAIESAFGQSLIARQYRYIEDLSSLANDLGHPKSILCLGNGPSSEEPAIGTIAHDCLFRVNHRWLDRGLLTKPDMVFTGNRSSIGAIGSSVIFGLQDMPAKHRLTQECLVFGKRLSLSTIECLGIVDVSAFSGFRPTNGAVMLATAVALQPKRLIVAGIDLFDHPKGSYPGDTQTPNAYTIGHDRNTELRFILQTLDRYDGELIIHGEVLAEHWRRHQAASSRSVSDSDTRRGAATATNSDLASQSPSVDIAIAPSPDWPRGSKLAGVKP